MRSTSHRLAVGVAVALAALASALPTSTASAATATSPASPAMSAGSAGNVGAPPWPARSPLPPRLAVVPVPPPRHRVQARGPLSAPCPLVVHALVAGDGVEPLAVVALGPTRRTLHVGDALVSLGQCLAVRDIGSRYLTLAQGDAIWRCPLTTLPRDNR